MGANGPCTVHVNFGQMGFVFIEANVKKWGLAPMTGSLAPPPPYGSEQGSILLEAGRDGLYQSHGGYMGAGQSRARAGTMRSRPPTSPGPARSPTDISLAQLEHVPTNEDVGEGTSNNVDGPTDGSGMHGLGIDGHIAPPPEYYSPQGSEDGGFRGSAESGRPLIHGNNSVRPPVPSYDSAMGNISQGQVIASDR